jgi:hypothetical protein
MPECDLSRLNASSFEKLVRALAFAELGPGGTVFSPGPDGARDFIYDGAIKGFESKKWNGYLIIQAKFREKIEHAPGDISWLEAQIAGERDKFKDERRGLRKPEYYILATNVSLSGADRGQGSSRRKGGHTKISDLFESWKSELGLKDFHLWPADQIIDLLARHPTIRQTFAAWVTPGDVLMAILAALQPVAKDFTGLIQRALKQQIAADKNVPLNEAGSVHSNIPTSKVFIDLPVATHFVPSRTSAPIERDQTLPGFVSSLIDIAKSKLDPVSLRETGREDDSRMPVPNRIVLLGGPGQGKSTTGLFAVQIFRAAILNDDPSMTLNPTICDVVPEILDRAKEEGIATDVPRRFPVHIRLPDYADRVSQARNNRTEIPSLVSLIAHELERAADASPGSIRREDLRLWLQAYPWLIVLDGLDEVPPSGERPAVIDRINGLVSEISDHQADVLVVVTSRPQGYNKDLDEKYWAHWYLADLPAERAHAYAGALSRAQYPFNPDRREKFLAGVKRAMTQPATARLMVSPLQVTIMHVIIDGEGSTPTGHWGLFNEYFQVLKKREKAKGGETQEILEKNWEHLDPVHYRVGLVLQAESEISGGAGAHFNRPRLKALIKGYLRTSGYPSKAQEDRSEELARLALNRLVLLSMRQQGPTEDDGLISFDVRSLQEFMAAAELTTEAEAKAADLPEKGTGRPPVTKVPNIEDRLTHIAGIAHWRYVFLIAASRCFSDTALHHLRSVVVSIPRTLDAADPDRAAHTGASLALEMLSDGIGVSHPISRNKLVEHALELLELGPQNFDDRLVIAWSEDTATVFEDRLRGRLSEGVTAAALAAWKLLFKLCSISPDVFCPITIASWPNDPESGLKILSTVKPETAPPGLEELLISTIRQNPPAHLFHLYQYTGIFRRNLRPRQPVGVFDHIIEVFRNRLSDLYLQPLYLQPYRAERDQLHLRLPLIGSTGASLTVSICPTSYEPLHQLEQYISGWNGGWAVLSAAASFSKDPCASALARCLREIRATGTLQEAKELPFLPWPVEGVACCAADLEDLEKSATVADAGGFGDADDWLAAEKRWITRGISREDLLASSALGPFGREIASVGAPIIQWLNLDDFERNPTTISGLLEAWADITNRTVKSRIADAVLFTLPFATPSPYLETQCFIELLETSEIDSVPLDALGYLDKTAWQDESVVDYVSRRIAQAESLWTQGGRIPTATVADAYTRRPFYRSLLYPIAAGCIGTPDAGSVLSQLPSSAFDWQQSDEPCTTAAVGILRILKFQISTSAEIAALTTGPKLDVRLYLAQELSKSEQISQGCRATFLTSIRAGLAGKMSEKAWWLYAPLKRTLDARKSEMSDRAIWVQQLQLPEDAFDILSRQS